MSINSSKWRSAQQRLRDSERICQHACVLAVLREAISLGCILLFCSSVVQAQVPAVPGTAQANPTTTIRSSQGTSAADQQTEKKTSSDKRPRSPERVAARMDGVGFSSEPLQLTSSLANTFGQGDLYTYSSKPPLYQGRIH